MDATSVGAVPLPSNVVLLIYDQSDVLGLMRGGRETSRHSRLVPNQLGRRSVSFGGAVCEVRKSKSRDIPGKVWRVSSSGCYDKIRVSDVCSRH